METVKRILRDGTRVSVETIYCAACRKPVPTNATGERADGALVCRRCAAKEAK